MSRTSIGRRLEKANKEFQMANQRLNSLHGKAEKCPKTYKKAWEDYYKKLEKVNKLKLGVREALLKLAKSIEYNSTHSFLHESELISAGSTFLDEIKFRVKT